MADKKDMIDIVGQVRLATDHLLLYTPSYQRGGGGMTASKFQHQQFDMTADTSRAITPRPNLSTDRRGMIVNAILLYNTTQHFIMHWVVYN